MDDITPGLLGVAKPFPTGVPRRRGRAGLLAEGVGTGGDERGRSPQGRGTASTSFARVEAQGHGAGTSGSGRARTDLLDQLRDLLVDLPALLHLAGDLLDGVDHRGVVALAEDAADGGIAVVRELAGEVHGHLAGGDEGRVRLGPMSASTENP